MKRMTVAILLSACGSLSAQETTQCQTDSWGKTTCYTTGNGEFFDPSIAAALRSSEEFLSSSERAQLRREKEQNSLEQMRLENEERKLQIQQRELQIQLLRKQLEQQQ